MFFGLVLFGFVDDGDCFELVEAAKIPGMGLALGHHFVGNEGFGAVERVALAEGTVDAHFARAVDIYIGFGDCVEFVVLFMFVHIREDLCVV